MGDDNTGDSIKIEAIYKWIAIMKQDGLKHVSINHYLRDVRTFLYWCMNTDRTYISPPFKIELQKGQEETLKTFTEEEQEILTEKPRRNAPLPHIR